MKKNYIARRRGTSLAAAALSFALVAPFAQPVAFAAEPQDVAQAQADDRSAAGKQWDYLKNNPANQNPSGDGFNPDSNPGGPTAWNHVYWRPGNDASFTQPNWEDETRSFNIDAIASGQVSRESHLTNWGGQGYDVISGRALIVDPFAGALLTPRDSRYQPLPDSIPVYLQWIDNDGAVSPVYSARTAELDGYGRGTYAFAVPQWIDANGKKHRFKNLASQRYRIWVDPTLNPETGNELAVLREAPGMAPRAFGKGATEGVGDFAGQAGVNGNAQNTGVFMYERPHGENGVNYMKPAGEATSLTSILPQVEAGESVDTKYILDDLGPIGAPLTHRDPLFNQTVSGRVWLEDGNERQLLTGATPVSNDPAQEYRVYATSLSDAGAQQYASEVWSQDPELRAKATQDFVTKYKTTRPDFFAGTVVAKTDNEGKYTLRFPDNIFPIENRETRQDNLYMWVEDPSGKVIPGYSTFTQPVFQNPGYNNQWTPVAVPGTNNAGLVGETYARQANVNFALVANNNVEIDIVNFDTGENPSTKRGEDVAVARASGDLPENAFVEWRDRRGNVVGGKKCAISDASDLGDCAKFPVPKDAKHGDVFYAVITNGYNVIAADSFVVRVEGPQWADEYRSPSADPVKLPNIGATDAQSLPLGVPQEQPKFTVTDKDGNPVSGATVEMDDRGNLTFTPAGVPKSGDSFKIEVEGTYQKIDPQTGDGVWELDEKGEKKLDNKGEPIPVTETRKLDDATVFYVSNKDDYEPTYNTYVYRLPKDGGNWGPSSTRAEDALLPSFTGRDGAAVDRRDVPLNPMPGPFDYSPNTAFEITALPAGWTDISATGHADGADVPGEVYIDRKKVGQDIGDGRRGLIRFVPGFEDAQGAITNGGGDEMKARRAAAAEKLVEQGVVELPVKVTYKDGTFDETTAKIKFVFDDAGEFDTTYGETTVQPGAAGALQPTVTDADGNPVDDSKKPQDFVVDPNFKEPEGYAVTVDKTSGLVTVTAPSSPDENTAEVVEVPVVVTYRDGSNEVATATFNLDTDGDGVPDVTDPDDDNDGVSDEQEKTDGTNSKDPSDFKQSELYDPTYPEVKPQAPNAEVTVAPEFTKNEFKPGETTPTKVKIEGVPEGATFAPKDPEQAKKDGATVDPNTGVVTVKVPANAKDGDTITVPVVVTYNDKAKSTDEVTVEVPVVDKTAPGVDITNDKQEKVEKTPIDTIAIKVDDPNATVIFTGGNGDDGLPEGLTFTPATEDKPGEITGTPVIKDWKSDEEKRDVTFTVVVTDPSGNKTEKPVTITVLRDTDGDGVPDVTDPDDDNDGVSDEQEKTDGTNSKDPNDFKQSELYDPTYPEVKPQAPNAEVTVAPEFTKNEFKPGETTPTKVKIEGVPEGATFAPKDPEQAKKDGVSVDPATGVVTVKVPANAKDGDTITVPVVVTYDDKAKSTDEVTVEVPVVDKTAPGVDITNDKQEKVEKTPIDTIAIKVDDPNATVIFTGGNGDDGLPEGLTFTPATEDKPGEITGTPVIKDWKSDEEKRDVTFTVVVTDPSGNKTEKPVTITVLRDTDGDGVPDVTDPDDDNDGVSDEQEKTDGTNSKDPNDFKQSELYDPTYPKVDPQAPNAEVTVAPEFTKNEVKLGNDGKPVNNPVKIEGVPEGAKFAPKDPEQAKKDGATVDPNTGVVTVKVPANAKDGDTITVPVVVTYNDKAKSTDEVTVEVPVVDKTAPVVDVTNDKQEKVEKTPIDTIAIKVDDPNATVIFTGGNGDDGLPEGLTFTPATEDKPGEITGTPVIKDWKSDEEKRDVTFTVVVTDPSGNKTEKPVTITVTKVKETPATPTSEQPAPTSAQPAPTTGESTPVTPTSEQPTPTPTETPAKDPKVVPGENTEVPNTNEPTTVGKVENPRGDEQGKLIGKDGKEIPGSKVEIDPKTGEIKVTVPKGTDPQDATVVITGKDKDGKDQEIGKIDVKITGPTVKGEDSNVPNDNKPHTVGEVENPRGDEQGKLIGKDGEEIPGSKVEITPEGEIKVTVPENTKPQEGKVVVTDNEGNKIGEVPANVIDKDSDAGKYEPKYGDPKDIKVGETEETVNPFGDVKDVPVKEVNVTVPGTATNWTVEVVTEPSASGVLKVTAPTTEQVAEEFKKFFPENPKTWAEVVEKLTPFAKPEIDVEFVYNDGSKDAAKAGFNLVDKDGKSILDPTGDIDGDGKTNEQEIKEGTDPTKIESGQNQNDTTAPTVNPVKDTDKEIKGKGDRPGEKIVVTFPDGKTVETTTDKNGEWTVKVPEGTKLETGKTITVTDGDGNKTDTTVTDGTAPKVNPVKDTDKQITGEGRPGETLTVTFPDGKKVTVKVGDDGKWSVKVPEGTKLETGKKITVEDQDGNKTEVTIDSGRTAGLTDDERNRCIATSVGFGLPLLALIPLGLATQIAIPGLTPVVEQVSAQIQAANSRIQQQFGIFNPQMAAQVAQVDAQLRQFGLDVATVGAGVVLLAAGILAGTIIYDNCTPGGGSSNATLKDAELKGSSGRTYLKVDKEEKEMKK